MKWNLKDLSYKQLGIMILTLLGFLFFTTSFYMFCKAFLGENAVELKNNERKEKSEKIDEFVNSVAMNEGFFSLDIKDDITVVDYINEGRYVSHILDYYTGDEVSFDSLIKEDKRIEFYEVVKELLYNKYPGFIAEKLSILDKSNVYLIRKNELVIYFYDYVFEPNLEEDLFLKVNYNEVKDYLTYYLELDSEYTNEDGFSINQDKKLISITFDDGPSGLTKGLIDTLNSNKARSTFFMVTNKLNNYRDTVQYVYQNKNEVAYHSYQHKNFKRQTIEEIQSDLEYSNSSLKEIIGEEFRLVRPPYGAINDEIKEAIDMAFVLWSVDTEDWRHKDVDYLVNYTIEHVKEGDIILFHDIHKTSVEAIKQILPLLYVRGYQVVTVSDLAKYSNKSLDNHVIYRHFVKE